MTYLPDYINTKLSNTTIFSPVTLNQDWPLPFRLFIILLCGLLGIFLNGCFVSIFFVDRIIKRTGYIFLVNLGFSDLTFLATVTLVSATVTLSGGEWDTLPVCHSLQLVGLTTTYCYNSFFALVAVENYLRVYGKIERYTSLMSTGVTNICGIVFLNSFLLGVTGVVLHLDYDYCQRQSYGNRFFKRISFTVFHCIPFLVTMICLILTAIKMNRKKHNQNLNIRIEKKNGNISSYILHIIIYLLYVVSWVPYITIVNMYPDISNEFYYYSIWLNVFRVIFTNFLYCVFNANFRRTFVGRMYSYCGKHAPNTDEIDDRVTMDNEPGESPRVQIMPYL